MSNSTLRFALMFLIVATLLPLQSSWAQTACVYSLGGCQCNCDGLSGLPPQNPPARSYDSFIIRTYQGAYGRTPTCLERQDEYWNLVDASYSSDALLEEAKRFVSTRFETQGSYDIPGIDPSGYTQTPEYERRNPSYQTDRISLEAFVGDLYKAFLQRSPDLSGQCFWSNNVCSEGRKKGIEAFKVSIEFGNLVNGLFDSGEPCPPPPCRGQLCE
ncbi:MAG TPA: DUF4214 domain-containing protein [Thermoanaerobaculia bacterium]|jgi:hypothetical protein|nr:DUF4214 domain-containing protein [Thermoanaerobaculia bacterium]